MCGFCTHVQLFVSIHSVKSAMTFGLQRARIFWPPSLHILVIGHECDCARTRQIWPNEVAAVAVAHFRALTPFAATHPEIALVTPFPATHTNSPFRKSFACHTSEKHGGWGPLGRPLWSATASAGSVSTLLARCRPTLLSLRRSAGVSPVGHCNAMDRSHLLSRRIL